MYCQSYLWGQGWTWISNCMNLGLPQFCLKLERCNIFLQITVLFLRASHILFLAEEKAKINKADCALHNDAADFYSSQILFWPSFWPRGASVTVLAVLYTTLFHCNIQERFSIFLLSKTSKFPINVLKIQFHFGNAKIFHHSEGEIK